MADFKAYYPKLLKYEGGYASPEYAAKIKDSGGETYLGIARNYNKTWPGWVIIDAYKTAHGEPKYNSHIPDAKLDQLAMDLSKKLYWDKLNLDNVKNQSLAEFIMDYGFNSGLGTPVKAAQNYFKKTDPNIKVDGVMGNDTINKVNSADTEKLFNALQEDRINLINRLHFGSDVKGGLLNRAKSFAYDHKGVVIASSLGLFFFIGACIVIYIIYKSKNK